MSDTQARQLELRTAEPADVPALLDLIAAHAHFEQGHFDKDSKSAAFARLIAHPPVGFSCFVAVEDQQIVGYATVTTDYSTWNVAPFAHLDTLFLSETARNRGIGSALFSHIREHAQAAGLSEIQWQTPSWNADAMRFYEKQGATASEKARFVLRLSNTTGPPQVANLTTLRAFTTGWGFRSLRLISATLHPECSYSPSVGSSQTWLGKSEVLAGIKSMWAIDRGATVEFGPVLESGEHITRTWVYRFSDRKAERGVDLFRFADGLVVGKDAYRKSPSS